jgi:hypothetical protein
MKRCSRKILIFNTWRLQFSGIGSDSAELDFGILNCDNNKKPITLCLRGEIGKDLLPINKKFTNVESVVVTGMEDQLLMCSFQLPELLPFTSLRGVNCPTESAYEL